MYSLLMEIRHTLCHIAVVEGYDFLLSFRKDKLHNKEQA